MTCDLQFGLNQKQKAGEIIEPIDLSGNWEISFDPGMGGPESYQLEKLTSWSETGHEGIRYYSGKAIYSRDFSVDEGILSEEAEAYVIFEDIQEMASVSVNGNDCGIVWLPPYRVRITPYLKAGTNSITVEVINTWNNRIVGDLRNPNKEPFANTNAKARFTEESPLLKSGLMGKAEIFFTK